MTRQGLVDAGCRERVYGTPILPGDMTLLARIGEIPVIGVPACGLYHQTTGFDLLLPRIMVGLTMGRKELAEMGHGGGSAGNARTAAIRNALLVIRRLSSGKISRTSTKDCLATSSPTARVRTRWWCRHLAETLIPPISAKGSDAWPVQDITLPAGNQRHLPRPPVPRPGHDRRIWREKRPVRWKFCCAL